MIKDFIFEYILTTFVIMRLIFSIISILLLGKLCKFIFINESKKIVLKRKLITFIVLMTISMFITSFENTQAKIEKTTYKVVSTLSSK